MHVTGRQHGAPREADSGSKYHQATTLATVVVAMASITLCPQKKEMRSSCAGHAASSEREGVRAWERRVPEAAGGYWDGRRWAAEGVAARGGDCWRTQGMAQIQSTASTMLAICLGGGGATLYGAFGCRALRSAVGWGVIVGCGLVCAHDLHPSPRAPREATLLEARHIRHRIGHHGLLALPDPHRDLQHRHAPH